MTDLEIWTRVGVTGGERSTEQRVLVTITFAPRSPKVLTSDRLADTVDYDGVVEAARRAARKPHRTLEALAHDIGRALLRQRRLTRATIEVRKCSLPGTASVAVSLSLP